MLTNWLNHFLQMSLNGLAIEDPAILPLEKAGLAVGTATHLSLLYVFCTFGGIVNVREYIVMDVGILTAGECNRCSVKIQTMTAGWKT
jgi:hypothetical protein